MQKIIDAHMHVFDLDKFRILWLDDEPRLNFNNTLKEYKEAVSTHPNIYSVEGVVHIELDTIPEQKQSENEYFVEQVSNPGSLIQAACIYGNMHDENLRKTLEQFCKVRGVKGVRHLLHVPSEPSGSCLSPQFVKNAKMLGSIGLHFEGCLRWEDLNDFYLLAKQNPDTYFVLNHMGSPDIFAWKDPLCYAKVVRWEEDIKRIASLSNTSCKLSELGSADVSLIRPLVELCVQNFGSARLMYATNFPVCSLKVTAGEWTLALLDCLEGLSISEKNEIFYKTAMRIYGIGE